LVRSKFQKFFGREVIMQYELEAVIIGFRFIASCRQDKSN